MTGRESETIEGESPVRAASVDPGEVARFAALAESWWDPKGAMAPIHKLNPARLAYIRDRLIAHFGRDAAAIRPFSGLRLIDVGCGGGLLAEPMCRLGRQRGDERVGVEAVPARAIGRVEAVQDEAHRLGISIAEFVRRAVKDKLEVDLSRPWMRFAGLVESGDPEPDSSADDSVYGPKD